MNPLQTNSEMGEDDLLATIDLYKGEQDSASEQASLDALAEIISRHQDYLYAVARRVAQNFPLLDYDVVYSEFTIQLFNLAGKFQRDRKSNRPVERQYKSWAGRIIELITKQMLKGATQEKLDEEYVLGFVVFDSDEDENLKIQELRDLMEEHLTEKERNVLWAWNLIHPLDNGAGRTPPEELETLAKNLGTTKVNLRQIRKRALDKLRKFGANILDQPQNPRVQ